MSPSMENTPSEITRIRLAWPSASLRQRSRPPTPLWLLVEVHRPRGGAHGAGAGPVGARGLGRGPLQLRMVRQVEVVVRAEHDDLATVHQAARGGGASEGADLPVQGLGHEGLDLLPEE